MTGILAIWNDCEPSARADYEQWYQFEHLPERLAVPGFVCGRRYEAIAAEREYFTCYDVMGANVLASPDYLQRLNNPTEWTKKVMGSFRKMVRTACDVTLSFGNCVGSHVVTLSQAERVPANSEMNAELAAIARDSGVARVQLWSAAEQQTVANTNEARLREGRDVAIGSALVVELLRRDQAERFYDHGASLAKRIGFGAACRPDLYSLLCIRRSDATQDLRNSGL